jgi:hypothetical protein
MKRKLTAAAVASGDHITGSAEHFSAHPDDFGCMIHETAHVVQRYRGEAPGWLVEGIADYIRFFKFETGKLGRLNANQARYDGSYQVSARFLAFVNRKYGKDTVRKVNEALRNGEYSDAYFQKLTGKNLQRLNTEWVQSLLQ